VAVCTAEDGGGLVDYGEAVEDAGAGEEGVVTGGEDRGCGGGTMSSVSKG
jgi:hypothetical protein